MFLLRTIFIAASIASISGCCSSYLTDKPSAPIVDYVDTDKSQWDKKMKEYGDILKKNNVRQIMFVYGTFVGNDPSGAFSSLLTLFDDPITAQIINYLKQNRAEKTAHQTGDEGNYTEDYVKEFCEAIGNNICVRNDLPPWSSANYHKARLDGAIDLAQRLADRINEKNIGQNDTILLLGHSHAGQLFALLTTFLEGNDKANALYRFMDTDTVLSQKKSRLIENIHKIKSVNLDFVTFGTPVRYSWGNYPKFRLMPVINHRSNSELPGVLTIRDGDYVQQWGVEGTDALPPQLISPEQELEQENELSKILHDAGISPEAFKESLCDKSRRQPKYENGDVVAENVLVDYKDSKKPIIKKLFGHAVYTNKDKMLFNTDLIVKELYKN